MRRASSVDIKSVGDLCVNIDSFELHIRAENLSPATLVAYSGAARQFHSYLVDHGMPSDVADIRREHVESFIADLLLKWKPATANNRYRGLQSFFKWAAEEGEVKTSPMANMKPPRIPENPPPVLREDDLKRLLATCEHSQDFESRRDAALIRVFIDTGARLSEVANLRWSPDDDTNNDVALPEASSGWWARDAGSASSASGPRPSGRWTGICVCGGRGRAVNFPGSGWG